MKIFLTIAAIMSLVLVGSVMAVPATPEQVQTTAAVTVNEFLDITIGGVTPVNFQSVDPGVNDTPANPDGDNAPQAVTITIEATTNVVTDTFLKGVDWTGPATLAISNVEIDDDGNLTGSEIGETNTTLTTTYAAANNGFFEDVACPCGGSAVVKSVYFWLTVPVGQLAGSYISTNIFFKTVTDGVTP